MFKNFFKGLKDYSVSFKLMNELRLWQFFLVPITISFIVFGLIGLAAYGWSDNVAATLLSWYKWETGQSFLMVVVEVIAGLSILLLGYLISKHIVLALSAPFMTPVSTRIEKHLYPDMHDTAQHRTTSNTQQLLRGIRLNVRNILFEFLITIPLLLLGFIPVIGIVFTLLAFLVQAYYAGFGNMDYTLERHLKYRESVRFVKKHRAHAVGNGVVFMAMLFIPFLGIILVLPLSATAASKTALDILMNQQLISAKNEQLTKNLHD